LHLLSGINSDLGKLTVPAKYDGIEEHYSRSDLDSLFRCIEEVRVTKTEAEIELMRYTHWVSCMARVEVMRSCKPGMIEYQLESLFQHPYL